MMQMPVAAQVRHHAGRFPDKTVLIEGARRLSYRQLDEQVDACAALLGERGLGKGDRVAILAPSGIDWIVCYLGIGRAGAAAVPLNWKLTAGEISAAVAIAEVALVLVHPAFDAELAHGVAAGRKLLVGDDGVHALQRLLAPFKGRRVDIESAASEIQVILLTGGTTGEQKAVMLSHENLFWNTLQLVVDTEMHEDDITVLATPLHHAGALVIWLLPHLYLGATAAILPHYRTDALIELIAAERVTNGWTPPSMTRDVLTHPLAKQRDLRSFARWYVAGGPFPRRDREEMKALIPGVKIFNQYGLTEAGVMVSVLKDKDYENAPDSIGRPFLHCDVKILREDLSDAATGEVGEIAVRSPSVMQGYYGRPVETAATFHDGWLRTGDLASMDAGGYLRFHDRLKDMVKTGGFNVYSQEIEQVLLRHPSIREIAVFGIPSERWGEEVVAVAVVRDGHLPDGEAILAFARENLARYKVPKQLHFVAYEALPINYSGKIVKKELRQRFRGIDHANS
ncbi:MAG: class I adenylate-forming enzyme family protein [Janthinobacterium lividum]